MTSHILLLINTFKPGGAERQVLQDVHLLQEAGYEVTLAYGKSGSLAPLIEDSVKQYNLNTTSEILAILKMLYLLRDQPVNLMISHGFWANKVVAVTSLLSGLRFLAFEHGLGLWRKWYHLRMVQRIASRAQAIVTCSEANRQLKIKREKLPGGKIYVIPNSFVSSQESRTAQRVLASKPEKPFVIGYCGRFNRVKQLEIFIKLANQLRKKSVDFKILMLGDGEEKKRIMEMIEEENVQDNFELTGYVRKPEEYYPLMDCFFLPSKREDFSLSLIEASDAKLPCLAFDVGGNKEIIQDKTTGFIIPPFELDALTNQILTLMNDPKQVLQMGSAAHKFVNQHFSQIKRAERLSDLINRVQGE